MSDAKVKAEARRAKILGREANRLALAKGDIVRVYRCISNSCHQKVFRFYFLPFSDYDLYFAFIPIIVVIAKSCDSSW